MAAQAQTVYLAGAGPGDPGLLTVRARELLSTCDCIVFDALVSPAVMALANPAAEQVYVGKRGNQHTLEQPEINSLLAAKAQAGKSVLRLKGGDPYLFGRGAEEALFLVERNIPVEVIPGVTAGIAAPACAGIPVTYREDASTVAFVTGHEKAGRETSKLDFEALARIDTLCFYMGVKNLERIAGELAQYRSPKTPAAVIEQGSTPRQRTVVGTLSTIARLAGEQKIKAPALTIVGDVVALHDKLNFFERRTLFGRRVMVTRAKAQAGDLGAALSALGAEVIELPTIRIVMAPSAELANAVQALSQGRFDWLILTSVNGVEALSAELDRQSLDVRAVKALVTAVGSSTARHLAEMGIRADLVPKEFVAEEILKSLSQRDAIKGRRFLLARADIARPELPDGLRQAGGAVTEVVAYRTVPETEGQAEALAALERDEIDVLTFTSASTVQNFARILGEQRLKKLVAAGRPRCVSIGPITTEAMKAAGILVSGEAEQHDIPGLVRLVAGVPPCGTGR